MEKQSDRMEKQLEKALEKLDHLEEMQHKFDKKMAVIEEKVTSMDKRLEKQNGAVAENILKTAEQDRKIYEIDNKVGILKATHISAGGVAGAGAMGLLGVILKYFELI